MEFHPIAALFPLMEGDEFRELVDDIKDHGLREPVILYEGMIIDGRNRHRACARAGIEPRFEEWDGNGSVVDFVVSKNLHRRHLTPSQRAAIALEAHELMEAAKEEAAARKVAGLARGREVAASDQRVQGYTQRPRRASAEVATAFGIKHGTLDRAQRIAREAPEELPAIKAGEKTVNQVYESLRKPKPPRVRITLTDQITADYNAAWVVLRPLVPECDARHHFEELQARLVKRALDLQTEQTARQNREKRQRRAS